MPVSIQVQFCSKGHDTFICGRNKENRCRDCRNDYYKIYNSNHKEKMQKQNKEWSIEHKEELLKKAKKFRLENLEYFSNYMVQRRLLDTGFRLCHNLRTRLNHAVKNNFKGGSAIKDLGCTLEFFKKYLESKFYGDMTWDNYGSYWEIDHIKELHTFDLTDPIQLEQAVHYTNLQPLTINDHQKKTAINRLVTSEK